MSDLFCGKCGSSTLVQPYLEKMPEVLKCCQCGELQIVALSVDELKTLRAKINGKLGKRKITKEQQEKMQAARLKKQKQST